MDYYNQLLDFKAVAPIDTPNDSEIYADESDYSVASLTEAFNSLDLSFPITHYEVCNALDGSYDNALILVISDLHLSYKIKEDHFSYSFGSVKARIDLLLDLMNTYEPSHIVFLGDSFELWRHKFVKWRDIIETYRELFEPIFDSQIPVYFVRGESDQKITKSEFVNILYSLQIRCDSSTVHFSDAVVLPLPHPREDDFILLLHGHNLDEFYLKKSKKKLARYCKCCYSKSNSSLMPQIEQIPYNVNKKLDEPRLNSTKKCVGIIHGHDHSAAYSYFDSKKILHGDSGSCSGTRNCCIVIKETGNELQVLAAVNKFDQINTVNRSTHVLI